MTSHHLDTITNHLAALQGQAFFRPQDGPLKERLTQEVMNSVGGELAETLAEGAFDLEASILLQEDDSRPVVSFSVDYPGVAHTSQIALALLADDALDDLAGHLARLSENAAPAEATTAGKTLLRKKSDADHHEKGPASARLKVSPEWLKRVVPCTDYSYEEIEGKKYIREYYWSRELIDRLFRIKSTKTTPEDLQYVAKECCEGDVEWARDLIARLKSPNRPESPPKEQPQKPQGRPAQGRPAQGRPEQGIAAQGRPEGRAAQGRPEQGRAAQGRPEQGRAAQGRPEQGKAAQGRPEQGKAAQGRPEQAQAAPSERQRPRSRNKKPVREPGKEGGAKPEPAAAQSVTR